MRTRHAGLAAALLLAMVAMVVAGGRMLQPDSPQMTVEPIAPEDLPPEDLPPVDDTGVDEAQGSTQETGDQPPAAEVQTRPPEDAVDPERAVPPPAGEQPLERIAPRAPLSELSLAVPPKPKAPEDLAGGPLFRPVAEAAGVIAVKGHSLTVSGIEVVEPDETCTDSAGKDWPCGALARTAFRSFLRGRAVTCAAPDKAGAVRCRIGNQDIGGWLVENGWARASKGSPYEEAAGKASHSRKGIYGPAPDMAGVPPVTGSTGMAPSQSSGSILDLSGEETPPATPPTGQPAPFQ